MRDRPTSPLLKSTYSSVKSAAYINRTGFPEIQIDVQVKFLGRKPPRTIV